MISETAGYRIEGEREEPVLAAYGIREDGKKVLLSIAPGSRESTTAWKSFINDMRSRGLKAPLLAISDGNPGVMAAIEEIWPHSLRQRRIQVIPHFFEESAAMKLIYATLVAASKKWRGIEMSTPLYALLSSLREDLLPKEECRFKQIA